MEGIILILIFIPFSIFFTYLLIKSAVKSGTQEAVIEILAKIKIEQTEDGDFIFSEQTEKENKDETEE